jgi:hypothetical protein
LNVVGSYVGGINADADGRNNIGNVVAVSDDGGRVVELVMS